MLDTIPSEINIKIVAFVIKPDFLNLRLASRRLHQETWQAFGSAFFRTVYFDFCIGSFVSLQKIAQHEDLRLFVRELRVGDQGSCNNDGCQALRTDHRLLFVVSGLPISSLRFESVPGAGFQPQKLPCRVIESPAVTAPWADALTELRLDWEFFPDQSDMVHIAAIIITRASALRRLHLDLYTCDASAILSRLNATPEVSPLTHLVMRRFHTQERQLSPFLRRFEDTLLYLHMSSVTLDSGEWATLLSESRHSLSFLEHFTLCEASYMNPPQISPCFFDDILQWNRVPVSGKAEFVVKPIRLSQGVWNFRVSGIRYQGKRDDMRQFLIGWEECAGANSLNHGNEAAKAAGWKREDLPLTLVIAGRLKAVRFQAKKFDSIFDRPSDRVPRHNWL